MQAEHSLEEKKRAGDPVDRFGAAHLQITGNTYGSGMSIRYLDLSNYCFLHFECISFNNICTHFSWNEEYICSIFIAYLSTVSNVTMQSDHDTRIWYHRWAASKQSLLAPQLFFSLRPCLACFVCQFSLSPRSTWEPVRRPFL